MIEQEDRTQTDAGNKAVYLASLKAGMFVAVTSPYPARKSIIVSIRLMAISVFAH